VARARRGDEAVQEEATFEIAFARGGGVEPRGQRSIVRPRRCGFPLGPQNGMTRPACVIVASPYALVLKMYSEPTSKEAPRRRLKRPSSRKSRKSFSCPPRRWLWKGAILGSAVTKGSVGKYSPSAR